MYKIFILTAEVIALFKKKNKNLPNINANVTNNRNLKHLLTAGEDQLPHERANVTSGSENSNPNLLLAAISFFFEPLGKI